MKLRKDDKVRVISGNHKGEEGIVRVILAEKNKVQVEGVNLVKKHLKPSQNNQNGGIVEKEAFIDASKVMLVCKECGKAVRTGKVKNENGKFVRICKACKKPV